MSAAYRLLRRVGGVAWTLALPTLLVLAGLGAGFALAPRFPFAKEDPRWLRIQSGWHADEEEENGRRGKPSFFFETQLTFKSSFHPRATTFLWITPSDRLGARPDDRKATPVPGLELRRTVRSTWVSVGAGWWAAWAGVLSLNWWPWAWRTGRFAGGTATDEHPRRAALGRAGRPWVLTFAAMGALCLAVPHQTGHETRLMAEVRRDPYVWWHPRALWVAWNRPLSDAETAATSPGDPNRPAEPLGGGRRWGLTAERAETLTSRQWVPLGLPDRDVVVDGRRTAVAVSLWWVFLPAAVWYSIVSLRRSERLRPGPPGGGSSIH